MLRTMTRRLALAMLTALATGAALLVVAEPAQADAQVGAHVDSAYQVRSGWVTVTGWAFDRQHRNRSIGVCVWSKYRCRKVVQTSVYRGRVNDRYGLTGRHGFRVVLPRRAIGDAVTIRRLTRHHQLVATGIVSTPGTRAIAVARSQVGRPYRYGGTSPSGFDCSGYTQYVYNRANVASLSHQTESQRHASSMRRITRAVARPGDLVFYLSGGRSYHVAIYAGRGMQYAATTPGEGVRYQGIWSRAVEYRTDWH